MDNLSFTALFFRLYDRKIASGEITFSSIGMSKAAFTALCQGEPTGMNRRDIEQLCTRMKLTTEETQELTVAFLREVDIK